MHITYSFLVQGWLWKETNLRPSSQRTIPVILRNMRSYYFRPDNNLALSQTVRRALQTLLLYAININIVL